MFWVVEVDGLRVQMMRKSETFFALVSCVMPENFTTFVFTLVKHLKIINYHLKTPPGFLSGMTCKINWWEMLVYILYINLLDTFSIRSRRSDSKKVYINSILLFICDTMAMAMAARLISYLDFAFNK